MKDISLHPRQRKLIYILNGNHGIIKGLDIAKRLNVSERTIRNDISEINSKLSPELSIEAVYGKGYEINIRDRQLFHSLFSKEDSIESKDDRIRYLIIRLIKEDGYLDALDLEEVLFISHTTLENDIKSIKNKVSNQSPYLKIIRKGNKITFEDDEDKKRRVLIQIYCENWDYDSREGIVLKDEYINQETLNQVRRVLKDIFRRRSIVLDDFGLIFITMAITIAYGRISSGHRILEYEKTESKSQRESELACKEIWDALEEMWNIKAGEGERAWTRKVIHQLIILGFVNHTKEEIMEITDEECETITLRLLEDVKKEFNYDFSSDDELHAGLLLHLQAIKNNMISVQEHSMYLLSQLRKEYPKAGQVAWFMRKRLEDLLDMRLGEVEESYLLPFLIPSWEKLLQSKMKEGVRTVLVSHLNSSMTGLLIHKIRETFGDKLKLLGPVPIYDKERIDELDPSLIISTVKMDAFRTFKAPIIITAAIFTDKEEKEISLKIREILDSFFETV